jgi:membrane associated rhomboid family serine protease
MCPNERPFVTLASILLRMSILLCYNHIGGVMVSVLAALRSKSKDWLARNQNNVSEWSVMSIHGLLFQ